MQCFVIQPFDNGKFDRRYKETWKPAIEAAGFTAYRVDEDPSVTIPIEAIEEQIRHSDVCLADVSTSNPNVWYELGFALAAGKDVVLISEDGAHQHYPFDIQHRRVIGYSTESRSDHDVLASRITERLVSIKKGFANRTALAAQPLKETAGLSAHEIAALAFTMKGSIAPGDAMTIWSLTHEMSQAGFTEEATVLAAHKLKRRGFLSQVTRENFNGEQYVGLIALEPGINWLLDNEDKLQLRVTRPDPTESISF